MKKRVRRFSTLKEKVTVSNTREKRASNPGRVRRSGNKFAWNSETNNLKKCEFKS